MIVAVAVAVVVDRAVGLVRRPEGDCLTGVGVVGRGVGKGAHVADRVEGPWERLVHGSPHRGCPRNKGEIHILMMIRIKQIIKISVDNE